MKNFRTAALVAILSAASGCQSQSLGLPHPLRPGTEQQQQTRAQRFDPYPENDIGPAVVGGRPLEYSSPRAEILRVQPRLGEPQFTPPPASAPNW
jgi:hypothetical protein